jgi:hypothetical protein
MPINWRCLAATLTLAAVAPASAQGIKPAWGGDGPSIHRMEIRDGQGNTTVRYFFYGLSPGEQAALYDLELSENELAYAEELLALRRDVLATQRALERQRLAAASGRFNVVLPTTTGGGFPSTSASPAAAPYGVLLAGGGVSPFSSCDEGVLRGCLSRRFAEQATPEYAAQVYRQYVNAQTTAALVLKNPGKSNIRVAGIDPDAGAPRYTTLTLTNGQKPEGLLIAETRDWIILGTPTGEKRFRPEDVVEMEIKVRK